jgi:hypothetical protein
MAAEAAIVTALRLMGDCWPLRRAGLAYADCWEAAERGERLSLGGSWGERLSLAGSDQGQANRPRDATERGKRPRGAGKVKAPGPFPRFACGGAETPQNKHARGPAGRAGQPGGPVSAVNSPASAMAVLHPWLPSETRSAQQ